MSLILKYYKFTPMSFFFKQVISGFQNGYLPVYNISLAKHYGTPVPAEQEFSNKNNLREKAFQLYISSENNKIISRQAEEMLKYLKQSENFSSGASLALLHSCSDLSWTDKTSVRKILIDKIWSFINEHGGQCINIKHYNGLLKAYVENECLFDLKNVLLSMKKRNLEPNMTTYQYMIKAYCLNKDISGASTVLDEMKGKNFQLTANIFQSLITYYCQADDVPNAMELINVMKEKGMEARAEVYLPILCAYGRAGNIEEMRSLIKECEEKKIFFEYNQYLDIIYALVLGNHEEYINEYLQKLRGKRMHDAHTSNVILKLLYQNYDSSALKLYTTLYAVNNNDYKNYPIFIIQYFLKNRSPFETLTMCKKLQVTGILPLAIPFVLREAMRLNDYSKALAIITEMSKLEYPVRTHYFWPVIIQASKIGQKEILEVLQTMKDLKINMCKLTIEQVLLPNYIWSNDFTDDLEKLEKYIKKWRICMNYCVHLLNEKKYVEALNLVRRYKLTVDKVILNKLANSLCNDNVEIYTKIIYYLMHDVHLRENKQGIGVEKTETEEGQSSFLDHESVMEYLVEKLVFHNPNFITCHFAFLEALLKNNIRLSDKAALTLLNFTSDEQAANLVKKLQSPSLTFNYEEEVLKSKEITSKRANIKLFFDKIRKANKKGNNELALKMLEEIPRVFDIKYNKLDDTFSDVVMFTHDISESADKEIVEKAKSILQRYSFTENDEVFHLIRGHSQREGLDAALTIFENHLKNTKQIIGLKYLVKRISEKNDENKLRKLINIISDAYGKSFASASILMRLLDINNLSAADNLIDPTDFDIGLLRSKIRYYFKIEADHVLLNFLLLKKKYDLKNECFNELLEKYVKHGDVSKIVDLLKKTSETEVFVFPKLRAKLVDFLLKNQQNPENFKVLQRLKYNWTETVNSEEDEKPSWTNTNDSYIHDGQMVKANSNLIQKELFDKLGEKLLFLLQEKQYNDLKNNISANNLIQGAPYSFKDNLKNIAIKCIEENQMEIALNIWKSFLYNKDWKQEKEIYYKCLNDAEKRKTFQNFVNSNILQPDTIFHLIPAVKTKEFFRKQCLDIPLCYDIIIEYLINLKRLDEAVFFIKLAFLRKHGNSLSKDTIESLRRTFERAGKSFPFSSICSENEDEKVSSNVN